MKITQTVLWLDHNGTSNTTDQCGSLSTGQVAVHVLRVASNRATSRNSLRNMVGSQRTKITQHYKETLGHIHHSIAYGRNVAVLAIGQAGAIGIDIEPLSMAHRAHIADIFFTPKEQALLNGYEDYKQREDAFRYLWTMKEAAIKCDGGTVPANLLDIELIGTLPPTLPGSAKIRTRLTNSTSLKKIHFFTPSPDHICALAFNS
ncbi:MAG: 4'-phosphopantetheinyl transferase superfamily protein [Magnetovibrio sp.]|nr:4'-phosphopantetheinyl transferase superfamily protein [Magnetovibrio sp.]